jgi:hypothetical protein
MKTSQLQTLVAILAAVLMLLFFATPAVAQVEQHAEVPTRAYGVSPEINVFVGIPTGAFSRQVDNVGIGGTFAFLGRIRHSPVSMGVELGGMIYGMESRREPFSTTIPDVTVRVQTSNNVGLGHFMVRLSPQTGLVQPYVDAMIGGKYLFTSTSIESEHANTGHHTVASSTNFDDLTWSYGAGGGLNVRLYDGVMGDRHGSVHLNLGVRYLYGGEAEYLKRGSIRRNNGSVEYDVMRSRTDMIMPQFGVRMQF